MSDVFSGMGSLNATPAISFYTIIDEDISLIKFLIVNNISPNIFNYSKVKSMTIYDLIRTVYKRKYKNPMYLLLKSQYMEKYKDYIDTCYNEFISEEDDILSCAISTEIVHLITEFKRSSEIQPTIMYYNDKQKLVLDSITDLDGVSKKHISEIEKEKEKYTQYYFKNIDEIEPFKDLKYKTFYFSSCGLNLNENNDDISMDEELIKDIIMNNSHINIFDMYISDILQQGEDNE